MRGDITEIRINKEKLYRINGIDRVCKYVYVELHQRMTQEVARGFLEHFTCGLPVQNPYDPHPLSWFASKPLPGSG